MSRFTKFKPSKTVAVGIACAVVLVVAVTLFAQWSQGKALPPTDLVQTPSTETSAPSPESQDWRHDPSYPKTEAEKAYYNVWGFCPDIYSPGWKRYRLDISPSGEVTAVNLTFSELLTTAKAEYDEGIREGKFPQGAPTDFQVALGKECRIG
jgi:hypothetical protein